MASKKKIKKSIESFEKLIRAHEEKLKEYKESSGKNYALIEYWEKEIEIRKKQKNKKEDELEK